MFSYDKKIHLFGSLSVCLVLSFIIPMAWAVGITLALGVGKELIYDWAMKRGTPEWTDFAADVAGVIVAVIIRW